MECSPCLPVSPSYPFSDTSVFSDRFSWRNRAQGVADASGLVLAASSTRGAKVLTAVRTPQGAFRHNRRSSAPTTALGQSAGASGQDHAPSDKRAAAAHSARWVRLRVCRRPSTRTVRTAGLPLILGRNSHISPADARHMRMSAFFACSQVPAAAEGQARRIPCWEQSPPPSTLHLPNASDGVNLPTERHGGTRVVENRTMCRAVRSSLRPPC